jgi:hypothetical protein
MSTTHTHTYFVLCCLSDIMAVRNDMLALGVWHSVWSSVIIIQAGSLLMTCYPKVKTFFLFCSESSLSSFGVFCCKTTCHSLITSEGAHVLQHTRVDVPFTLVSIYIYIYIYIYALITTFSGESHVSDTCNFFPSSELASCVRSSQQYHL